VQVSAIAHPHDDRREIGRCSSHRVRLRDSPGSIDRVRPRHSPHGVSVLVHLDGPAGRTHKLFPLNSSNH